MADVRRRAAALVLALGVVVALAAGCDDGGDDDTPEVAEDDAPFCDAYDALLVGPLADPATDASDRGVLAIAVLTTQDLLIDLNNATPDELRNAVAALHRGYAAAFLVLERYAYDLARVSAEGTPEEQAAIDSFGLAENSDSADAFAEIQRFVADRCAPDVTLPPELQDTTTSTTSP